MFRSIYFTLCGKYRSYKFEWSNIFVNCFWSTKFIRSNCSMGYTLYTQTHGQMWAMSGVFTEQWRQMLSFLSAGIPYVLLDVRLLHVCSIWVPPVLSLSRHDEPERPQQMNNNFLRVIFDDTKNKHKFLYIFPLKIVNLLRFFSLCRRKCHRHCQHSEIA